MIFIAPNIWVLVSQENLLARKVAYIFQWIILIMIGVFILIWAIAIFTDFFGVGIAETFCASVTSYSNSFDDGYYNVTNSTCERKIKGFMWAGLLITAVAIVPLQYLFFSIFKAFYEEKAENGVDEGGYEAIQ